MSIFKSKETKQFEKKLAVKRSLKQLEKRIAYLDTQVQKYAQSAQVAMKEGLPDQVNLVRQAIKMTIDERKRTYKMLLNAQIISQMKDMNSMTKEFVSSVQILTKEIASESVANMSSIKRDFAKAMSKTAQITEEIEELIDVSEDGLTDTISSDMVADEEIDNILYGRANSSVSNEDLDQQILELSKQLDNK